MMKLWRGLNVKVFELTGSQSWVLNEEEAEYHLVLGRHNNTEPTRSRLGDQPGGATRKATGPEKTDGSARGSWGLEL